MKLYEILFLIIMAFLLIWNGTSPANGACRMSYCKNDAPKRERITNPHRQIKGDLYAPSDSGRTQIRDNSRRIIGYIETDGSVTNTHRQKIGKINER